MRQEAKKPSLIFLTGQELCQARPYALAEGHLAYFISNAVGAMDLSAFVGRYGVEGPGNQAFGTRMMVKVLSYG